MDLASEKRVLRSWKSLLWPAAMGFTQPIWGWKQLHTKQKWCLNEQRWGRVQSTGIADHSRQWYGGCCEILHQLIGGLSVDPIIYRVSTIQGDAGFRNHPRYGYRYHVGLFDHLTANHPHVWCPHLWKWPNWNLSEDQCRARCPEKHGCCTEEPSSKLVEVVKYHQISIVSWRKLKKVQQSIHHFPRFKT